MLPFDGWIEIELRFAALTVSGVLLLTPSNVAEMLVLPTFFATAKPLVVIEAIELEDDFQVAVPLTSCIVPSENVVFAVNCWVRPKGSVTLLGATTTDTADADVTVSAAVPETVPEVAVMVELPLASAFANPAVGDALLTVATVGLDELQFALLVRFCVLLSV